MEIVKKFDELEEDKLDIELDYDLFESYMQSKQRELELNLDKAEKINKLLESAAFAIKGFVVLSGALIFFYHLPEIKNLFN